MEIRVGYDGVETGFGEVVWGEGQETQEGMVGAAWGSRIAYLRRL